MMTGSQARGSDRSWEHLEDSLGLCMLQPLCVLGRSIVRVAREHNLWLSPWPLL